MKIYIICPVRNITTEQARYQEDYVIKLMQEGNDVFYPPWDAPQESKTGYEIVMAEMEAISRCDRVDVFWDINSKGSHFDLGMAVMARKLINKVLLYQLDPNEKSYMKAVDIINENR